LDHQPLAKGKTEKTKKKKEGKNAQNSAEAGFMTVPAPQLHLMTNGNSPGPSASVSPVPKPGFSRISTMVDNAPSQEGTPGPGERPKVAFGLGTKRKADIEDAIATPPSKRR
jgi:U4/U6.U5 tri-snRNP-associated protein 1